ncbi:MAG: M23 family metallopeptidase [Candidatus Cloacimonadaceae bacterium]|nr:M23 family metallopeptidase [Candidatus Cloacimonadaceae bacterium]MDP3114973.1 M23 family metallopeptidase [Candidatus Cloacimonadaceae bacterium]
MLDEKKQSELLEPEIFPKKRLKLSYQYGGVKRTLKLPPFYMGIILVIFAGMLFSTVLMLFKGGSAGNAQFQSRLESENKLLRAKLDIYSTTVDSIYQKIDSLQVRSTSTDKAQDYPYYSGGGAFSSAKSGGDPALRARLSEIDSKLMYILAFLGSDVPQGLIITDHSETIPKSGDGIPSIYPTFGRVSDGWGLRFHPIFGTLEFHNGIDIANHTGTPIYATADGVVHTVDYDSGYGKRIIVSHEEGYESMYGHLYSYQVQLGDRVRKGQIIALMGDTGISTGPHLHYEVIQNGEKINPIAYLNRIDTDQFAGR